MTGATARSTTVRWTTKAAGTLAVAGLLAVLGAGVASAHVHAESGNAAKGGYGEITFRVPNEEDDAGTTKLQVTFPAEYPVGSASIKPVPGWKAKVQTKKLAKPVQQGEGQIDEAVSTVTWTAQPGGAINPGEFQEFTVHVGPLPTSTDNLVLPAVQTYDNGDVVRWDEPTKPGQPEPEKPAPSVALAAEESDGHVDQASSAAAGGHGSGEPDEAASADSGGTDDTARWLGGAGRAVGALGLGVGAGAVLRARKAGSRGVGE